VAEWAGRRVLVTGASSGIGAGLAEEFARRGAMVGICARRPDRLQEVLRRCQTHSPDSRMWVTDLAVPSAVDALATAALSEFVNVSSIAATLSSPGESAYDASKAALTAFSEAMAVDLWDTGVKVLVVYPGLVDTELFSLPDNDPVLNAPVLPIPVSELVGAVFDALDSNAAQVYVPSWFGDVAAQKAGDVAAFLAGTAAFVAGQTAQAGGPSGS